MQRKAGGVIGTRALEATRLDFKHVVTAVTVLVDPATDRITLIGRFDFLRPIASVREDAAIVIHISDQYVCRVRSDDEFERSKRYHHVRHAGGKAAGVANIIALAAFGLIRKACLEDGAVFRRQRRLLARPPRFGLIEGRLTR